MSSAGTKAGGLYRRRCPNPVNVYGRTKLAGDEAIQAVDGEFLILRTQLGVMARVEATSC